jgi:hypothetical protein
MGDTVTTRTFAGRWGISQRTIQMALGLVWILDATLQYQPRMWGHEFVSEMIVPVASGQPVPIAWLVRTTAHLIAPDPGAWNFLFATLQLAIGVGLLFRRTVRPALVTMFIWVFLVWSIGEGFGLLFTGHASPLTGAPGAALLYGVIGLLVWPSAASRDAGQRPGVAGLESSVGSGGPLGVRAPMVAWASLWCLSAVLWLQPANRSPRAIGVALANGAAGQPSWYAHFLHALSSGVPQGGTGWAWAFAAASLVIGIGPLASRRVVWFFVAGSVLELAYWVSGQALGGILTGMGTDPNAGPLVALLALVCVPRVVEIPVSSMEAAEARRTVRPALVRLIHDKPFASATAAAGVGALLLLSATYPQLSTATLSGAGMANMPGMTATSGSTSRVVTDASVMPNMKMAANALLAPEAMGGKDPSWHYDGPPLSTGETDLLTTVSKETDAGHAMQTPTCTKMPNAMQFEYAVRLVQETSADVSSFANLAAAKAAGYIPVTSPIYPVVHYVKPAYMTNQYVLDPSHVDSLVYATTPYGTVLVAAMYLMPVPSEPGPMPAGCMLQWHAHTNLCTSIATHVIVGFTPCGPGTVHTVTPFMAHIWQVPVPGGPLALDPSDLQTVQAAIMAQQCGEAPYNPATPPPPPLAGECTSYYGRGSLVVSGSRSNAFALAP